MVKFRTLTKLAEDKELTYDLMDGKPTEAVLVQCIEENKNLDGVTLNPTGDGYYNIEASKGPTKFWIQKYATKEGDGFILGAKLGSWDSTETFVSKDGKKIRKGHFIFFDELATKKELNVWMEKVSSPNTVKKKDNSAKYKKEAERIFKYSKTPAVVKHKYLDKKGVKIPDKERLPAQYYPLVVGSRLVVPRFNNVFIIVGREEITTSKKYSFSPAKTSVMVAQKLERPEGLAVVEGYATGLSVAETLPNWDVLCFGGVSTFMTKLEDEEHRFIDGYDKILVFAENSGNYKPIAEKFKTVFPPKDYDDFNDYHQVVGSAGVRKYVANEIKKLPNKKEVTTNPNELEVLGHTEEDEVVVFSPYIGTIKFITHSSLKNAPTFVLPYDVLWGSFGYPLQNGKEATEPQVIKRFWLDLMDKAKDKGKFTRSSIFGSGLFRMEEGKYVINCPDNLYSYNGDTWKEEVRELCVDHSHSFAIPQTEIRIKKENLDNPIRPEEFRELMQRAKNFDLPERMGELLILSFAAQNLSTLLYPRPCIYLAGSASGGKTFLINSVAQKLIAFMQKTDAFSTCAGVQKPMGNNCETVCVDEIGVSEANSKEIKKLFNRVVRGCYGAIDEPTADRHTVMGNQTGGREVTRLASSFILASVRPCIKDEQDLSRTIIFTMSEEKKRARQGSWLVENASDNRFWKTLNKNTGQRILSACVKHHDAIMENKELFVAELTQRYPNLGDRPTHNLAVALQMGTLYKQRVFEKDEVISVIEYFKNTIDMFAYGKEVERMRNKQVFTNMEKKYVDFASDGRRLTETFAKVCFSSHRASVRADLGFKVKKAQDGKTYLWFSHFNQDFLTFLGRACGEVAPTIEELQGDPLCVLPSSVPANYREIRKNVAGKRMAQKAITFDVTDWAHRYDEEQSLEESEVEIGLISETDG